MNRDDIIRLIEQELVQADEAANEYQFEKHMYTIHTLTSLYAKGSSSSTQGHDFTNTVTANSFSKNKLKTTDYVAHQTTNTPQDKPTVTAQEIEAMGGKVPNSMKSSTNESLPSNTMVTDDEIGNGDSIFDF
ncbi:hypothetical protein BUY43_04540 [Staphylococcus devriesei]|uniref:YwdI family protein n=1 Tax=Staphylococcus devriesei TaxID=586733 RepID=A0A2K4DQK4_9STAP|nr:DUF5327 family protein [Staphylococcus devriesei]MCE5090681.1 DUF5327 family protein [Staphylococcus devriesei]MCE5096809.1 DUF5327 family protein [Staphylococcus devriesei]PNZ89096.1 hypothetical protein CD147_03665 [Staphylococcus devriesei]PTE73400.1 hypothetical protein BUY44_06065 [Staphylococcus devriesei]PTF14539.1 hypothetical protein BUY47_03735 [Staphylococcus devriesei]